jgi:protein SHQ1
VLSLREMITPKFILRQDDAFVYADIHAPHIKASDVEFVIDGSTFTVHCKPYFLKLNFEQQLVQDGREAAAYNIDAGIMTCTLPKSEPGLHFDNLDMITKLLTCTKRSVTTSAVAGPPNIEVVGGDCSDSDIEWYKQPFPSAEAVAYASQASAASGVSSEDDGGIRIFEHESCYGFGNKYKGLFADVERDMDILAGKSFDASSSRDRQHQRRAQEDEAFDLDAYMNDTYDPDDDVQSFLEFKAPWECAAAASTFSDDERDELQRLPRRSYVLTRQEKIEAAASLVGIMYAFCSDRRMGLGEGSCESGSNMARLAPPLCALDTCDGSIHDMVVACVRRSVTFFLYRSFHVAKRVVKDVVCALRLGRIYVIKLLLEVRRDLLASDLSLLVRVWIEDLLCWLQSLPDVAAQQFLPAVAAAVQVAHVSKRDLGFTALQKK